MTIRYYILPIVTTGSRRGPKYFKTRDNPTGINVPSCSAHYGLADFYLWVSDIDPTNHAILAAAADVLTIPLNIDANLTASAVTQAVTFLEAQNLPAGWVSTALTYRQVLKVVYAICHFSQRWHELELGNPFKAGVRLDTAFNTLPAGTRSNLIAAGQSFGFDTSGLSGASTVRQILKALADQWNVPYQLGGLVTL